MDTMQNILEAINKNGTKKRFIFIKNPRIRNSVIVDAENFGIINPYVFLYQVMAQSFKSFVTKSKKNIRYVKIDGCPNDYLYISTNASERDIMKKAFPSALTSSLTSVENTDVFEETIDQCVELLYRAIDNSNGILILEENDESCS